MRGPARATPCSRTGGWSGGGLCRSCICAPSASAARTRSRGRRLGGRPHPRRGGRLRAGGEGGGARPRRRGGERRTRPRGDAGVRAQPLRGRRDGQIRNALFRRERQPLSPRRHRPPAPSPPARRPAAQVDPTSWPSTRATRRCARPALWLVGIHAEGTGKLQRGKGGVWRLPPAFDGVRRSPVPRFTVPTWLPERLPPPAWNGAARSSAW